MFSDVFCCCLFDGVSICAFIFASFYLTVTSSPVCHLQGKPLVNENKPFVVSSFSAVFIILILLYINVFLCFLTAATYVN